MKGFRLALLIISLLFAWKVISQGEELRLNYEKYHLTINEAERLFYLTDNALESLSLYDEVFEKYEFIFGGGIDVRVRV